MSVKKSLAWAAFVIIFFLTRVVNLDKFPLFVDEAFYVEFCDKFSKNPKDFLFSFQYNTQPLFIWISLLFFKIFKNPILATRMISVFSGFLNLTFLFILVKKFFPKINSFFPPLFYLFLPFNLLYDRLALLESLTLLTINFTAFASLQLIEKPSFRRFILLTLAFLSTALTKQIALFGIILSALFIGEYLLTAEKKKSRYKLISYFLLAIFIFSILFIAISLLAVGGIDKFILHFIQIPGEHFMSGEEKSFLTIWQNSKLNFLKLVLWLKAYLKIPIFIFTFLATVYALLCFKKRGWRRLLIWLAVIVISGIPLTTIFYPRHLVPITTPIIILDSYLLTELAEKLKKRIIFLFLILFFPCWVFGFRLLIKPEKADFALEDRFQYFEDWTSGRGFDEVAQFLQTRTGDKRLVVYTEPYNLTLVSLKFHPLLINKEIVLSQEKSLYDPIKETPDYFFKLNEGEEKFIIRNRNPGLPQDWPVKLVKEITKSRIRKIQVYQIVKK